MSDLFPFTASNGVKIENTVDISGAVYLLGSKYRGTGCAEVERETHATGSAEGVNALREFFQTERDASLDRWRSKEHPDYVVYPNGEYARIVREVDGTSEVFLRLDVNKHGGFIPVVVAREFFGAHPEPKPWHNAKPGEVWELTYGGQPTAHVYTDRTAEGLAFVSDRAIVSADDPDITAGRRIYPEQ